MNNFKKLMLLLMLLSGLTVGFIGCGNNEDQNRGTRGYLEESGEETGESDEEGGEELGEGAEEMEERGDDDR